MPHVLLVRYPGADLEIGLCHMARDRSKARSQQLRSRNVRTAVTRLTLHPEPAKRSSLILTTAKAVRKMAPLATISLLAFAPFGVTAFTLPEVASTKYPPKVLSAVSSPSTQRYEEIHNKIPKRKIPSTKPRHGKDVVQRVETIQEYKDIVVNEPKKITVVRFFTKYCKSCQASAPLFYKLAHDYATHARSVKFVEVPLTKQTKLLHEALGIPSLPFSHIYHPDAGLCEERAVSKKHIAEVEGILRCYVFGECQLPDDPGDCMKVYGECDIENEKNESNWG